MCIIIQCYGSSLGRGGGRWYDVWIKKNTSCWQIEQKKKIKYLSSSSCICRHVVQYAFKICTQGPDRVNSRRTAFSDTWPRTRCTGPGNIRRRPVILWFRRSRYTVRCKHTQTHAHLTNRHLIGLIVSKINTPLIQRHECKTKLTGKCKILRGSLTGSLHNCFRTIYPFRERRDTFASLHILGP